MALIQKTERIDADVYAEMGETAERINKTQHGGQKVWTRSSIMRWCMKRGLEVFHSKVGGRRIGRRK